MQGRQDMALNEATARDSAALALGNGDVFVGKSINKRRSSSRGPTGLV
jgi:hypothetical protein